MIAHERAVVGQDQQRTKGDVTSRLQEATLSRAQLTEIIDLFAAFNQVGVTALIATHDANAVARAAAKVKTRTIELRAGELVSEAAA